ncbi:MAG: RHS repeat domain-containing protein, partial [Owenweeksia sp.]
VATRDALNRFAAAYAAEDYGNVYFNNDENDLWGMELKYNSKSTQLGNNDPLQSTKLYNGNIAEMHWKSAGDQQRRAYGYRYDGLNRLTAATYKAFNYNNELWDQEVNRYSVPQITYDLNGNIGSLQRKGFTAGDLVNPVFSTTDDLSYTYSGDQLLAVSDAATYYSNDFNDGNQSGNDYGYDVNGNLTADLNKGITISYNHLNLPLEVSKDATHKVEYIYAANGTKLQKTITDGSTVTVTDYSVIGNYANNNLDFIFTGEGRAVDDNGTWRYEYYYKDQVGNTRLGFSDYDADEVVDETEITQQQNYYPFGLEHKGTDYGVATQTTHKYLYNGKELQDELALNWIDYGARNYDVAVGRWFNVDPLCEDFFSWTSYHYVHNNPINMFDPDGRSASPIYNRDGELLGTDDQGLQGKAIVMDKENFKQGMTHEQALNKSLGAEGLKNDAAKTKLLDSYNSLSE